MRGTEIKKNGHTVKPVLRDHIKQDIFSAFQTGGCLLLHESDAENSCMVVAYYCMKVAQKAHACWSFLHYFHAAICNHLSIVIFYATCMDGRLTQV